MSAPYALKRVGSPLGEILLVSDGENLLGLWFTGQKYALRGFSEDALQTADLPLFGRVQSWLDGYFAGERPDPFALPLAPRGSAFQHRVWGELVKIPYGETRTYGEIARTLGVRSARAVGNAVGRNPISLIIPCHRVVGSGGALTGYAGGLKRKAFLLRLEGVPISSGTAASAVSIHQNREDDRP